MSLRNPLKRSEIAALANEVKQALSGAKLLRFEEILPRQYVLAFERGIKLFICLQEPYLRFHLLTGHFEPSNGSHFSHQVRQKLEHLVLTDAEMVNQDRIVQWTFSGNDRSFFLIAEFFPKKPNLYFLDKDGTILTCLNPTDQILYQPPKNLCSEHFAPDANVTSVAIQSRYELLEQEAVFQKQKHALDLFFKRQLSQLKKGIAKAEENLLRMQEEERWRHEALLLQAYRHLLKKGMVEVVVEDWENGGTQRKITLDPSKDVHQEIESRFLRSKKLKAGMPYAEKRLVEAKEKLKQREENYKIYEQAVQQRSLERFLYLIEPAVKTKSPEKKNLPYHEFFTEAGLTIWVGKNAQGNEKLTFSCAHGEDGWFHVEGYAGSHVVLRSKKNLEPDFESIQDALNLAVAYSKAKDKGEADVCMTQCKYVNKLGKGKTGKVQISKHRAKRVILDAQRLQRIKNRTSVKIVHVHGA